MMKAKKVLALLLSVVMLMGLLAGCGGKDQPAKGDANYDYANDPNWFGTDDGQTTTLRFWAGIQPEYGYQQMVDNFNEEYKDKGVQVEFNRYVNNSDGNLQLETYLMSKEGVDVFIGYGNKDKTFKRAEGGMLYEFSGYLKDIGFDVAKELGEGTAIDYIQEDGSIWGLPTKFDNQNWMMINVDAFKEAGIEIPYEGWTYDEFKAACKALTKGDGQSKQYAVCWGLDFTRGALDNVSAVLTPYSYFKDDSMTETNFDDPVWATGLQLVKDTMDNGWAISLADDLAEKATVQTTFLTGKSAMFMIFSQLRIAMDTENYPHDFVSALVPFPVPSEEYADQKNQASGAYAGDIISIADGCQNKKAACEFMRWYIQGGMNPLIMAARYPLWTGNDVNDILQIITEQAQGTVDVKSLEYLFKSNNVTQASLVNSHKEEIKTIMWEEWQNFLYGKTATAEQAMQQAKTRADAVLK